MWTPNYNLRYISSWKCKHKRNKQTNKKFNKYESKVNKMLNMISVLELINVWTYFSNNIDKENKKHDRVNKKTNSKIVCKLIKWKKKQQQRQNNMV